MCLFSRYCLSTFLLEKTLFNKGRVKGMETLIQFNFIL